MMMINIARMISSSIVKVLSVKAKKVKLPGPKNPPNGISDKGLLIWPEFWKKYGKLVRPYKDDYLRAWATAVAIYKNYALKRNIPPFSASASYLNQDSSEYMKKRLTGNRDKIVKKLGTTLKLMSNKGLTTGILKERIDSTIFNKKTGNYNIISKIEVKLPKDTSFISPDIKQFFQSRGFAKKHGKFEFTEGPHRIFVYKSDKKSRLLINNVLSFTPQHIKFILGLNDEDMKNKKKVEAALSKEYKKLITKNAITNKITGYVLSFIDKRNRKNMIDFNVPLDEEENKSLEKVISIMSKLDPEDIKNQYDMNYIRSLGTPLYQFNLIKQILRILDTDDNEENKTPDIFKEAIKDPNSYLNPKILLLKENETEKDPESDI